MDDDDRMVLDNIDEFVNDESKIVSYKWLSLSLSLNVNKATKLLEEYLKKSDNELDVIYFVGGRKTDGLNLSFCYKLVKRELLDEVKTKFDEVTTCHIYSIQKSCVKDSSVLYNNHVDVINEHLPDINKHSSIQCDSVKNLSETLKKRIQDQDVPITNGFQEVNEVEETPIKPQPTISNNKTTDAVKSKPGAKKKETSTKSFFGKASDKKVGTDSSAVKQEKQEEKVRNEVKDADQKSKQEKQEEKFGNKVKDTDQKSKVAEKKDISSAFAKVKNKKVVSTKEVNSTKTTETSALIHHKEEIKNEEEKENYIEVEKEKDVLISDKSKCKLSPVRDVEAGKEKSKKKRKAPVVDSSSEDDDFEKFLTKSKDPTYKSPEKKQKKTNKPEAKTEHGSDEDDICVIEPTPEPVKKKKQRRTEKGGKSEKQKKARSEKAEKAPTVVSKDVDESNDNPEKKSGGKRRGRRMVMKSKQYLDDDGFMVTRKECESESFSEESDTEMSEEKMKTLSPERKKEVEKKKVVVDLEKKAKVHLSKPKTQASLMNFFKKK